MNRLVSLRFPARRFAVVLSALALGALPSRAIPFQSMPNGNTAYYYNVGTTGTYVDTAGRTWTGDRLYDSTNAAGYGYVIAGNVAWSNTAIDIKHTDQDSIYYSERWNSELEFRFDLPATVWDTGGCYRVTLKFSENFFTAANQRKFRVYFNDSDVTARGYRIADNLDIFARALDTYTAYDFVVPFFPCNDGTLKVTFTNTGGVDNPKVCGIAVEKVANIISDLNQNGIADENETGAMTNDAFLDMYEYKIFRGIYDNVLAGDQYYLPPSELDINSVGFQNHTSIASISPAIAAYIVGAYRGWISYNEAYTRVYGILQGVKNFKKGPNTAYPDDVANHYPDAAPFFENSAYDDPANYVNSPYQTYHHHYWRDPNSSRRLAPYPGFDRWRSIDDNGDLVIGFWLAQEYFRGTDAEVLARQLVEDLDYNKWSLFADYSEKMLMFLASAGSPRASTYNAQAISAWNDANGATQGGRVLYWSQWPNLWYDGRYTQTTQGAQIGRNDFQTHATLVKTMRDRTVTDVRANPAEYNSYDYDAWGLSAASQDLTNSGGVWYEAGDVYIEGVSANDIGTGQAGGLNVRTHGGNINPFATVASLPFLPTEITNAMRHMYWRYFILGWPEYMGTGICGNYGFVQTWNIGSSPKGPGAGDASGGSFFSSAINGGFDMGPQIIAIENYRSGLVWNLMMANDNMQRAMNRFGMAGWTTAPPTPSSLNKTAVASSVRASSGNIAGNATDDDKLTRWESEYTDNEWIYVDLGSDQTISSVVLWWKPAYASQYDIQVAANGADPSLDASYATVYTDNAGNGGVDRIALSPSRTGRYVRMKGRARSSAFGYSLYGFDIFSTELAVPGLIDDFEVATGVNRMGEAMGTFTGGGGTASSNYETDTAAGKVYDGIRSRWITFNVSGGGQSAGYYSTLDNGNYDARSFSALSFYVKGNAGGEKLQVRVKDTANVEPGRSADSYLSGGITTSWKRVIVPLTDFTSGSAVNLAHLNNVSVYFSNAQGGTTNSTVWIDDLKLVTAAEIPPDPPSDPFTLAKGTQILLKWSDTNPVQIAGYNVYRRQKDTGTFTRLTANPVTTVSYTDADAALAGTEGTTYEYYVTKVTTGGLESNPSDTRTAIYGAVEIDWDDGSATNYFGGNDLGFWGATAHFWTNATQIDSRVGKVRSLEGDPGFGGYSVLPNVNVNQYGVVALRFDVKGNAGGESFQVGLKDRTTSQEVKVLMDTHVSTSWQTFVVPLDPYISGGVDISNLDNLSFTFQGQHERFYVDNIMFMPSGGSVILVENFDGGAGDLTNYQGGTATLIASGMDPLNVATMTNVTTERHSVQRSLQMTFNPGGTQPRGFSEPFPSQLNASATKYLTFWVKGSDPLATTDLKVTLDDGGANATVSLCTYVTPSSHEWRRAVIPLSDFPGVDTKSLDNIKWQFNGSPAVGGSLYFDDIQFTLSAPTALAGFQIQGPDTWTFGVPFGIVIKAAHSDSGLIRTFTGTCSIAIPAGDTIAPLSGTVTNGVGSVSVTITGETFGAKVVTVTDSTGTKIGSKVFQMIQGSFRVETMTAGPYHSGDSIVLRITALDFLGDTLTSFTGRVTQEIFPGRLAPALSDSFVAGVCIETVSIHSVGGDTIRVSYQNATGTRALVVLPPMLVDDFADGVDPNNILGDSFSWPNGNYRGTYTTAASKSDSGSFLFEFDAQAGVTGGIGQSFIRYGAGMNISSCTALSFWILGGSGLNKADRLYTGLRSTNGVETTLLVCSYVVPVSTMWRKAYIPLKDFKNFDSRIVDNWHFKIVPDAAGLITGYLDDVRLETALPDTYVGFELSAPPSVIAGDSFQLRVWALHKESGVYTMTSDVVSCTPSMGAIVPTSRAMTKGIMTDSFALTTPGTVILSATAGNVTGTVAITVLPKGNVIVDDMEGDSRNNLGLTTFAWGVASRALVTDQQKSGLASTHWTFNAANNTQGGLQEDLGGLNVSSLNSLALWVRADTTLDDTDVRSLFTSIRQNGGAETILVLDSYVRPISTEWRRAIVPLSAFTGLDTTILQDFNFVRVNNTSGVAIDGGMYVDDVLFTMDTQGNAPVDFEIRAPSTARAGDSFVIRIDARHAEKGIFRGFADSVQFTSPAGIVPARTGFFSAGIRFETISIPTAGVATIAVVDSMGRTGSTTITIIDTAIPIDTFYQVSPASGIETTVNAIRFEWTLPADTAALANFRLQVARSSSFASFVVDSVVAANESSAWASLFGADTFHWRVQAVAVSGNTRISLPGDSIVLVDTEPPVPFGLLIPAAGTETRASAVTFRWSASSDSHSGLNHYQLQIARDSTFAALLVDSSTGLATESTIALAANDTYFWRVRAIDDLGNIRNATDTFRILQTDTIPPIAFGLSAPANLVETSSLSIAFSWTSSGDTLSGLLEYRLQLSRVATFAALFVDSSVGLANSTTVVFAGSDTVFWRVAAVDSAGNSTISSETRAVIVDVDSPLAFAFDTPVGGAPTQSNVRLAWYPSGDTHSGLASYQVQVANDSIFSFVAIDTTILPPDTDVVVLVPQETWFWRVLARDDVGNVRYAANGLGATAESFVSAPPDDTTPPTIFYQLTPAARTETSATSIVFSWSASSDSIGLAHYRIQLSPSSNFASLTRDSIVPASKTSAVVSIFGSDTYHWRVLAVDLASNTTVSLPGDSVVVVDTEPPVAFGLTAPANGYETAGLSIPFSWQSTYDTHTALKRYQFQVSRGASFAALIVDSTNGLANSTTVLLPGLDTYYWRAVAIDTLGNQRISTETRVVYIDTQPPAGFGLAAPPNNLETSFTAIRFSWSASGDSHSGLNHYQIQVSRAPTFATFLLDSTALLATETPVLLVGTDTYFWRVMAYDNAGNTTVSSETRTLFVDTTPPLPFSLISPRNGESVGATVTILWSPSGDTHSGLNKYTFDFSRDSIFSLVNFSGSTAAPDTDFIWTPTGNDTWFWRVFAVDVAGNTVAATPAFDSFVRPVVDTQPPAAFSLTAPADGLETAIALQAFAWTASSDSGSGLNTYRLQIAADTLFSVPDVDSVAGLATTGTATVPMNDTRYWRVVAVDNNLNTTVSTPPFRRIIVDTIPPTAAPLLSPAQDAETSVVAVAFVWTACTDTLTGVAGYRVQVDTAGTFISDLVDSFVGQVTTAVFTLPPNDTYHWRLRITDDAGNATTTADSRFFIDTVPPTAPYPVAPDSTLETSAIALAFSWTAAADTLSGVADYRLQVDTAGTFASPIADSRTGGLTSGALALPANHLYRWRVIAIDRAGNTSASVDSGFTIDTAPPPAPTLRLPADVTETNVLAVAFAWDTVADGLSGVKEYRIQADTDGTFATLLADSSTGLINSGILSFAPNDTYRWRILVVDDALNTTATSSFLFVVDTVPPTAPAPDTPIGGADTPSPVYLRWLAATDTLSGVSRYRLQIDTAGTFAGPNAADSIVVGTETTIKLAADTYFWRVIAIDDAGNTTASTTETFHARSGDTTPPESFPLTAPLQGTETTSTSITFRWGNARDSSPPVSYRLIVDTDFAGAFVVDTTITDTFVTVALPANDTYLWRVIAIDVAGNTTAIGDSRVAVDTRPPTLAAIVSPKNGMAAVYLIPVPLDWNASFDSIAGFLRYHVQIARDTTFAVNVYDAYQSAPDTSVTLAVDTYYWRILVEDELGNVSTGGAESFRVTAPTETVPPETFALLAPVNGAETTATRVAFSWGVANDSSPPITYRLVIDTDMAGSAVVDTSLVAITTAVVTLPANDTYLWRVIARDVNANTTTVGDSRVAVDTRPPTIASPIFPIRGDRVFSPTLLSWSPSSDSISGVAKYRLQIDTSGTFTAPRVDSYQPTAAETVAALESGVYFWRVIAYDELGNVAVSAMETFSMAGADTVPPVIVAPPTTTASTVSNAGTETVVLTIMVDDSNAVVAVLVDLAPLGQNESAPATQVTDTIWTITVVFDSSVLGDTYDLKVTVVDPANNTSTTTIRIIVVDTTPSMADIMWQPFKEEAMAGNELSIVSTYGDTYASVRYEFRPSSGGAWQLVPSTRSNPDTQAPFWGIYWSVPDTLPDGSYDVRAVGTDKNGNTDPNPSYLRIKLNRVDSTVQEYHEGSTHIRRQMFTPYESGTLMIADGGTRFELPVGGVTETVWIRVALLDTAPETAPLGAGVQAPGGGAFRLFVREDGKRSFAKPFTLRIPYADTDLKADGVGQTSINEMRLALYWWDEVTHGWIKEQNCRVDAVDNVVVCQVNHFTLFAVLAGEDTKENLQSLVVYPNPFVPNDGRAANGMPFVAGDQTTGIIFDGLTTQATITVYNIAGRRVAEMSKNSAEGRFHWDARADDGRELASGVYLAVVKSGSGETVIKKIMIIR